jgi:hypothetical protein
MNESMFLDTGTVKFSQGDDAALLKWLVGFDTLPYFLSDLELKNFEYLDDLTIYLGVTIINDQLKLNHTRSFCPYLVYEGDDFGYYYDSARLEREKNKPEKTLSKNNKAIKK